MVLVDVQAAVRDFGAMVGVVTRIVELVRRGEGHCTSGRRR